MKNKNNEVELVYDNLRDGIIFFESGNKITYCNNAACKILGKSKEELLGLKFWQVIPIEKNNDKFVDLVLNTLTQPDQFLESFIEYYKADGSYSRLRVSASQVIDESENNQKKIVLLITDLTEFEKVNNAFRRYASDQVAHFVLHDKNGEFLGGQSKEVSILMSDLRGFTAICSRLEPSVLFRMINNYLSYMVKVIEKNNGIILEFLGDGIFTVFGAFDDNLNHASDAIACAVEMENAMSVVNDWNIEHGYPQLEMGIGINTGRCIVGNIGTDHRMKYACMGQPVNIAGRIESFTVGGQILASETTIERSGAEVHIREKQEIMPKGSQETISIFDVIGINGSHKINLDKKKDNLVPVKKAAEITFRILEGKMVGETAYSALVEKISDDYAYITCKHRLKKSNDIIIGINEDLYAKVVEADGNGCLICFTSKPHCFAEWKKSLS